MIDIDEVVDAFKILLRWIIVGAIIIALASWLLIAIDPSGFLFIYTVLMLLLAAFTWFIYWVFSD